MSEENKRFPGRPNYTGPTTGWFGLLHHDLLYEESDNVMERVSYVKKYKPDAEVAIRLHNMIWIDPVECQAMAKLAPLIADYEATRNQLYANILAYIKKYIPDCAWDGTELDFS